MRSRFLPAVLVCAVGLLDCKRKPLHQEAPAPVASPAAPPAKPILALQAPPAATSSSSMALGSLGEHVYAAVADEDANALQLIDVDRAVVVATLALPAKPGHVVVHGGGLAVALRETSEVRTVRVRGTEAAPELTLDEHAIAAPFDPLALYSDGEHLLIASGSSATLSRDGVQTALPRDPRAVILGPGGSAVVSHATGSTLSTVGAAGAHTELSLDLGETCTDGSVDECMTTVVPPSMQSYALARYEDSILVPSVSSLTDGPFPSTAAGRRERLEDEGPTLIAIEPSSGGYGGGNVSVPITFRIDVVAAGKKPATTELRSSSRVGAHECTLPRGLAVDEASHQVWLACLGDAKILRHEVLRTKKGLVLKRKQQLEVPFVTALAYDAPHARLLAYAPIERTVTLIVGDARTAIALPVLTQPDAVADGRRLFFSTDKRISAGKKACASCHPDGGDDGLAWSTSQGTRRTLALAGRVPETSIGWDGKQASLAAHVDQTIKQNLRGKGLDATAIAALVLYVRSMKAPASRPIDGAASARGKTLFAGAADCAGCHDPANRFSDGLVHDVGGGPFRTPSLLGAAGRGRLFHDGRYRSLDALFVGTRGRMGLAASLTPDDQAALQSYLATL